jgi:hypothetical protein
MHTGSYVHILKMLWLSTHWSVWPVFSCWVRHGLGCRPYSALPLPVTVTTGDIRRHQRPAQARGQLLVSPIADWVHQRRPPPPPTSKSRQKASPECPPPSWDHPRPQSPPGGGYFFCSTKTQHQRPGAEGDLVARSRALIFASSPRADY